MIDLNKTTAIKEALDGDHKIIWLQAECPGEDRLWCEDKVWPECDEEPEPTSYVRGDIVASLIVEADRLRTDLAEAEAEIERRDLRECTPVERRAIEAEENEIITAGLLKETERQRDVAEADLAEAVEALVVLNTALDAFWNAPDRGPVWNIRGTVVRDLSDAQKRSASIVSKHGGKANG